VNVYVAVPTAEVLITAGLHVPLIPLLETAGNAGAIAFWHNGPICVNVGVICALTVIDNVAVVAHCPAPGVNVYVAVPTTAVLITAGFHVPVTPLLEVAGSVGAVEFWHNGPIAVNTGEICAVTETSIVAVVAH
jgi:hypothetical protein